MNASYTADPARPQRRAVFLDKDGTLLVDLPYNIEPSRMRLAPRVAAGLRRLSRIGMPLIVVSNQPGVALGRFPLEALGPVRARLDAMFAEHGATLVDFYACPHHPRGSVAEFRCACLCRKPMPGMLQRAAAEHGIDLERSWFVGDILDDVEAGRRAGCRTILIDNGNETEWLRAADDPLLRTPHAMVGDFDEAARVIACAWDEPVGPRLHLLQRSVRTEPASS